MGMACIHEGLRMIKRHVPSRVSIKSHMQVRGGASKSAAVRGTYICALRQLAIEGGFLAWQGQDFIQIHVPVVLFISNREIYIASS